MSEPIKKLYRSRSTAQIAGICAGLGEYMRVDPVVLRLILLVLTIATGVVPGIAAYLGAWIIVPPEPLPTTVRSEPYAQPSHENSV